MSAVTELSSAEQAWRQLDRGVRRDIVRKAKANLAPADLDTARIAARWALAARARFARHFLLAAAAMVPCLGLVMWLTRTRFTWETVGINAAPFVVVAAGIALITSRQRVAAFVGAANLRRLVPTATAVTGEFAVKPARISGLGVVITAILASIGVMVIAPISVAMLQDADGDASATLTGLWPIGLVVIVVVARTVVRWSKRHRPLLVLDAEALRLPHDGFAIAWSAIRHADFRVEGAVLGRLSVAFDIADPDGRIADAAPGRVRKMLRKDGWISLPVSALAGDPLSIVATARARIAARAPAADR